MCSPSVLLMQTSTVLLTDTFTGILTALIVTSKFSMSSTTSSLNMTVPTSKQNVALCSDPAKTVILTSSSLKSWGAV